MSEVFPKDLLLRVGGRTLARHGVMAVAGSRRGLVEVPITFARADATTCATYIDRDGLIRKAAANVPRIEWVDLDGDGVRETPGILLEGSRQNLILRSEEFDNGSWTITNVTTSANADTSPDGTVTADRLIEDGATSEHMKSQGLTATADVRHAVSVFAKAGTRNFLALTIRDVSAGTNRVQAWFNLATGAVGTVSNVGAGTQAQAYIVKLGNGWYRCMLVGACNNGDTTPIATVQVANVDGILFYTGDGASYISVWGAQFENNVAFPTAYIPTVGSAVTRAADSFAIPFNFGPVNTSILLRIARPTWADASGDLGQYTIPLNMGLENDPNLRIEIAGLIGSRTWQSRFGTSGSQAQIAIPAGAELKLLTQCKNAATLPAVAVDAGSGLTAFATGAPAFTAYSSQTLKPLHPAANPCCVLIDLMLTRGLFSFNEMSAIP